MGVRKPSVWTDKSRAGLTLWSKSSRAEADERSRLKPAEQSDIDNSSGHSADNRVNTSGRKSTEWSSPTQTHGAGSAQAPVEPRIIQIDVASSDPSAPTATDLPIDSFLRDQSLRTAVSVPQNDNESIAQATPPGQVTCSVLYLGTDKCARERFEVSICNKNEPKNTKGKIQWELFGVTVDATVYKFLSRTAEDLKREDAVYEWFWERVPANTLGCRMSYTATWGRGGGASGSVEMPFFNVYLDKERRSVRYWAGDGVDVEVKYKTEHNGSLHEANKIDTSEMKRIEKGKSASYISGIFKKVGIK